MVPPDPPKEAGGALAQGSIASHQPPGPGGPAPPVGSQPQCQFQVANPPL